MAHATHPKPHAATHKTTGKHHGTSGAAHGKHAAKAHPKPLTNAQLAAKEIYPHEKDPYKAIPTKRQGPGKLRGGHRVTLSAWSVNLQVSCLFGPAGASITGGYSVWNQISVPRSAPFTEWGGRNLYTMDLDLMFDGWTHRQGHRSVEADLKKLESMALRIPGMLTPPVLRLFGAVPHPELKWVIAGIDYGDFIRLFNSGARARQACTVHLMEYRDETVIQNLKAAATPDPPKHYKVQKGDDLKKLAAKFLGKSSRWKEIEKLNKGMRGFKLAAKWVGKTILIPTASKSKTTHKDADKGKTANPKNKGSK